MKVHLIKVQSIESYVSENVQSKRAFEIWLSIVKHVNWNTLETPVKLTIDAGAN